MRGAEMPVKVLNRKVALLFIVVAAVFVNSAQCKCANRIIYIEGRLTGFVTDGLSIKVDVTPDPNWEPQPSIVISDGWFSGRVYFDSTKSEGQHKDDCSRTPEKVEVILLQNGISLDRVTLAVSKAFVKSQRDYKLRLPITLHIRKAVGRSSAEAVALIGSFSAGLRPFDA